LNRTWAYVAPGATAIYAAGVIVMLCRLLAAVVGAQRLAANATVLRDGPLVELLQRLATSWSMRIAPALALTEQVVVPKVVGFIRPTILLPATAITGLSIQELEMVLAHELAHVKRYDMWVNLLP
jgi:beta-lactamase regulating signal transducer with metallopeptidase domain